MLTLYDYLPSQNAYKIRLLLSHIERPYRTEIISIFEGEGQSEEFLRVNPTGAVPAICLGDGHTLAESNAILMFLAEGTDYLPNDSYERAKITQWLFFEGEHVQSTVATLRHWVQTGKDKNRTTELIEMKRTGSVKTLSILDRELEKNAFLGGENYTIADISVFAYVHLADEAGISLSDYPHVVSWVNNIREQPRFLAETHPYSIDPYSMFELP